MKTEPKFSEFCCMGKLKPCSCGANEWVYIDDRDNGDWCEEIYECHKCDKRIYVELPD